MAKVAFLFHLPKASRRAENVNHPTPHDTDQYGFSDFILFIDQF